jgi:hypothetical protein
VKFAALDPASKIGLEAQTLKGLCLHSAVEDLEVSMASPLGSVHAHVGVPDHILGRGMVFAPKRDADARGCIYGFTSQGEGASYLLLDAPRGGEDGMDVAHVVQENRKLITTQPGTDVGRTQAALDAAGDRDEQLIAHGVAEAVVHELEVVQIEKQHSKSPRTFQSPLPRYCLLEVIDEKGPISEVGQTIVQSLVTELFLSR